MASKSDNSEDIEDDGKEKDASSADQANLENYGKKLAEMQKYIPFLEVMIARIEKAKDKARQGQLVKLKSLYDILSSKKQKLKVDSLEKCELVLKKLYEKVEKGDRGLFMDKGELQTGDSLSVTLSDTTRESSSKKENSVKEKVRETLNDKKDTVVYSATKESTYNKVHTSLCPNLKKKPVAVVCDKSDTSLFSHKPFQCQSSPVISESRQLEFTEKQSVESSKKGVVTELKKDKKMTISNPESPSCNLPVDKNRVLENVNQYLKNDNLSRQLPVERKNLPSEVRKNVIERPFLHSPLHSVSYPSTQDGALQPESLQKNLVISNEVHQKKNLPSSARLGGLRAKLAEEIGTVHKIGTSSGGALRNLVNKAENIKQNRILSLKPGTVIDLFNEKSVPPINSSKPDVVDSHKGNIESTKDTKKFVPDKSRFGLPKESKECSSSNTNVLSHLSPEELEKLVSENLGSLPSPAPETMVQILETISAKEKSKAMTLSHLGTDNSAFSPRTGFHSPPMNQMPAKDTMSTAIMPSPSRIEDNLPPQVNIEHRYGSHVGTSQGSRIPNSVQSSLLNFVNFNQSGGMGIVPGNVSNYCQSPYPVRNDSIPPLMSPINQRPSFVPPLMQNFPDLSSPDPNYLYSHQPPLANNQPEQFQSHGLLKPSEHFQPHHLVQQQHCQSVYTGPVTHKPVPVCSSPVSPILPSYSKKENFQKSFSVRDPRRRSLDKQCDDNELYSRRKNSENLIEDCTRDPRVKDKNSFQEESKRLSEDDMRKRSGRNESDYPIESTKRNDPRQRMHVTQGRDQLSLNSDSRKPVDPLMNVEKNVYNRSRDSRFSGDRRDAEGRSTVDQKSRNYTTERSLARDRERDRLPSDRDRDRRPSERDRDRLLSERDKDRSSYDKDRNRLSSDSDRYRKSHDRNSSDQDYYRRSYDSSCRNSDYDKKEAPSCSPLESLYAGMHGPKTGKGYGFQSFRIPKKKKEEPVKSSPLQKSFEKFLSENEQVIDSDVISEKDENSVEKDECSLEKDENSIDLCESNYVEEEVIEKSNKEEKNIDLDSSITLKGNKAIDVEKDDSVDRVADNSVTKSEEDSVSLTSESQNINTDNVLSDFKSNAPETKEPDSLDIKEPDTRDSEELSSNSKEPNLPSNKESDNPVAIEPVISDISETGKNIEVVEKIPSALEKLSGAEDSLSEKIKEEFTQELIGSYLRKSLSSGFCKKLLEKLEGAPLKGDKLKKIERIIVSSSSSDDDYDDTVSSTKSENKKMCANKGSKPKKQDSKDESCEKSNDKLESLKIKEEPSEGHCEEIVELKDESEEEEEGEEVEILSPKVRKGKAKRSQRKRLTSKKKNSNKKTKTAAGKTVVSKRMKNDTSSQLDSDGVDSELNCNKPKRKTKNELEKLHEDIRDMFISASVVNATGVRTCRLKPDSLSSENAAKKCEDESHGAYELVGKTKTRSQGKTKQTKNVYQFISDHESELDEDSDEDNSVKGTVKLSKRLKNKTAEKSKSFVSAENSGDEEVSSESSTKSKKRRQNTDKIRKSELSSEESDEASNKSDFITNKKAKNKKSDINGSNEIKLTGDKNVTHEENKTSTKVRQLLNERLVAGQSDDESSEDEVLTVLREKCLSEKVKSVGGDPEDCSRNENTSEKLLKTTISDSNSSQNSECSIFKDLSPMIILEKTPVKVIESQTMKTEGRKDLSQLKKDDIPFIKLNKTVVVKGCEVKTHKLIEGNEITGKMESSKDEGSSNLMKDKNLCSDSDDSTEQVNTQNSAFQQSVLTDPVCTSLASKKAVKKGKRKRWSFGYIKRKPRQNEKVIEETNNIEESVNLSRLSTEDLVNYVDKMYYQDDYNKVLPCKLCDFSAKSVLLVRHYLTEHPGSEVLISRVSQIMAENIIDQSVNTGDLGNISKKIYNCLMCNRVCTNVLSFYDHMTAHTGEYRFQCYHCPYKASNRDAIKNHCQKVHHLKKMEFEVEPVADLKDVKGFICMECNFVQLKSDNVAEHLKKFHPDADGIMKQVCFSYDPNWKKLIENDVCDSLKPMSIKSTDSAKEPDVSAVDASRELSVENVPDQHKVSCTGESQDNNNQSNINAFVTSQNTEEQENENVKNKVFAMKDIAAMLKVVGKQVKTNDEHLSKLSTKLLSLPDCSEQYESFDDLKDSSKISKVNTKSLVEKIRSQNVENKKENIDNSLKRKSFQADSNLNILSEDSCAILKEEELTVCDNLTIDKDLSKGKSERNCELSHFSNSICKSKPDGNSRSLIPVDFTILSNKNCEKRLGENKNKTLNESKSLCSNLPESTNKNKSISKSIDECFNLDLKDTNVNMFEDNEMKIKAKNANKLFSIVGKLSTVLLNDNSASSSKFGSDATSLKESQSENLISLGKTKSVLRNRLNSPIVQPFVKKYEFQDVGTTHIKVGYVSASLENGIIFFACNFDKCNFKRTSNADSFLQHVERCHENLKFQAVCSACFVKCDKSNESHMVSSFLHLLNSHLVYSGIKTNTSEALETCSATPEEETDAESFMTEINEPVVKDKPSFPQQPLLRVRRLSGDQLSSIPVSGETNLTQPSVQPDLQSTEGADLSSSPPEEDSLHNLKIESVISLNPSALEMSNSSGGRAPNSSYMFIPSVGNYLPVTKKLVKVTPLVNKCNETTQRLTPCYRTQALVSVLSPKKGVSSQVPTLLGAAEPFNQAQVKLPVTRKIKKSRPLMSRGLKPPEVYLIMTAAKKLRHLFKCMDKLCSFSCHSPKKFEVHCAYHLSAGTTTGKELDWRSCVYCSDVYNTPQELCNHIVDEHSHSIYQCAYCFYRAYSISNVVLHQNLNHINRNVQIFKCCPVFNNEEINKPCSPPHRSEVVRPYECAIPYCKQKTYVLSAFEKHLQEHASLRLCQVCAYCCVKMFKPANVVEHYKIHSLNLYQCLYCIHGTDTEEDMRTHLCSHHPDFVPKALMRVNQKYFKENSYDVEESPFDTGLGDLKECDFDDQKAMEGCILNYPNNEDNEERSDILFSEQISELQLSEFTGMVEPVKKNDVANVSNVNPCQTIEPASANKMNTRKSPRISLNGCTGEPSVTSNSLFLSDPVEDEISIIEITKNRELKRSGSSCEEPPSKKHHSDNQLNDGITESSETSVDNSADKIADSSLLGVNKSAAVSASFGIVGESGVQNQSIEVSDVDSEKIKLDDSNIAEKDKDQIITENLFSCGYRGCNFVSPDSEGLKEHFKVCDFQRDASKIIRCVHCSRTFKRVFSLLEHLNSHGNKRFSCSLCSHRDTSEKKAALHMKDCHSVSNIYTMPVDPLLTNKDTDLFVVLPVDNKGSKLNLMDLKGKAKKLSYCTNEIDQLPKKEIFSRTIVCNHCSYSTKVRKNMAQHLKCHEVGQSAPSSERVNPMPCLEKKEMMFDKMINLAGSTHVKTTKQSKTWDLSDQKEIPKYVPDNARYVCHANGCTYVTVDDTMLRHHIKALHSDEINYRCPHCSNAAPDIPIDKLGGHLKLHDIRLYKCAYCIYHHNQRYLVERHVSEKHPEKRPFVQVVREPETDDMKSGDERGELVRNVNTLELAGYSSSKPWQCNLCKAKAATEEQIKEHAGSLHGVHCQFKCGLCDYKADAASGLSNHFTSQHQTLPIKFISVYSKEDTSDWSFDISEINSQSIPNSKSTAPLWRKDKKRVRHIRGILLEDLPWKPKQSKNIPAPEVVVEEEGKFGPYGYPAPGGYYVCPRCTRYKSKNKADMQNHLYRELEYKMWVCSYCKKTDITKSSINRHIQKMHEGKPELISILTPNDEVETWVSTVLKRQNFLMKTKDVSIDDSNVRSKSSPSISSGIRPRRSSAVEDDIRSEDSSKDIGEELIIKYEPLEIIQSSPSKAVSPLSQTFKPPNYKRELEKYNSESTDDDSQMLKPPKPKKRMLPKRWRCGYCKVTTVQEKGMKLHLANKHPNSFPLFREIANTNTSPTKKVRNNVPNKVSVPATSPVRKTSPGPSIGGVDFRDEDENSDLFECRLCGLVGTMKELYVHNYNAHPHNKQVQVSFKGGKRFHCAEMGCSHVSQAYAPLKIHYEVYHPNKAVNYKMQVIAQPEIVDDHLEQVVNRLAKSNKRFHCPTCDFASDLEPEVIAHLKSHLLYKCLLCNTVFSSPVAGKSHIQELHCVPHEGNLKAIMSSDLITKNSPPIKVIYTARKSTALGSRISVRRQIARKSTSRLPGTWKTLVKSSDCLESDDLDSLSAKEFSFYGKQRTVENFNAVKFSMMVGNQSMNLTVTQLSKIIDINPKLLIRDLKYTPVHS